MYARITVVFALTLSMGVFGAVAGDSAEGWMNVDPARTETQPQKPFWKADL